MKASVSFQGEKEKGKRGNEGGKSSVLCSISKRFDTTLFGTMSAIEKAFPQILEDKEKWAMVREEILNRANKEKRNAIKLLDEGCVLKLKKATLVWRKTDERDSRMRLVEIDGESVERGDG